MEKAGNLSVFQEGYVATGLIGWNEYAYTCLALLPYIYFSIILLRAPEHIFSVNKLPTHMPNMLHVYMYYIYAQIYIYIIYTI